jgi:hypothetical protein
LVLHFFILKRKLVATLLFISLCSLAVFEQIAKHLLNCSFLLKSIMTRNYNQLNLLRPISGIRFIENTATTITSSNCPLCVARISFEPSLSPGMQAHAMEYPRESVNIESPLHWSNQLIYIVRKGHEEEDTQALDQEMAALPNYIVRNPIREDGLLNLGTEAHPYFLRMRAYVGFSKSFRPQSTLFTNINVDYKALKN